MSDHIANQIRAIADWLDGENPFVLGSGATIPYSEASEKAAELRRIAETLEAGVVVVPVEELRKRLPALIRATAEMVLSERRKLDNDQLDEELKDLSALSQTTAKMESKLGSFIEWLSRLQQNGGEGR